jgi:hypothetical protein
MTKLLQILIGLFFLALLSTVFVSVESKTAWGYQRKALIEESGEGNTAIYGKASVQERIIRLGREQNRVMEHLYYLTERVGARANGSENLEIACEWAAQRFVSFGLTNVRLEECSQKSPPFLISLVQSLIKAPIPIYNVVADIPGTELPDEYVIVGAHIDSDDTGTGASDNGAGVAAAMEVARILVESGAQPRRTIRFILFSGEEMGKVGSGEYVAEYSDLMPRISAMFNMDRGSDHISGIFATDDMLEDFEKVFAPVKSLNPDMPFVIQRVEHLTEIIADCCGSAGTSDHGPFFKAGVPAFQWLQKSRKPDQYRPHTKHDTYEHVTPEYQKHSVTVIALAALGTANLDHMLSRKYITQPFKSGTRKTASCSYGLCGKCSSGNSCCSRKECDYHNSCCPL